LVSVGISLPTVVEPFPATRPTALVSVAVVGMGYVGLPTALSFFEEGASIIGYDISERRLAAIRDQAVDLLPRDRAALIEALDDPRFELTDDVTRVSSAELVVICVPTPVDSHLVPDLSLLRAACHSVVEAAVKDQTIVLTSTTHVGATEELLVRPLEDRGFTIGSDLFVAFSPERIDPGHSSPLADRVPRVIGGWTPQCGVRAAELVGQSGIAVHIVPHAGVAEMAKLYENIFRAVNIALANELSDYCRELHLDVRDVLAAASTKPYGFMPFMPGPGAGGHCIPCDPHYLLWQLRSRRASGPVLESAMAALAGRPRQVSCRTMEVLGHYGIPPHTARILVYGVAYKPNVADVRESPALEVIAALRHKLGQVDYYDPRVPSITVDGEELHSIDSLDGTPWDLVLVHTVHTDATTSWIESQPLVLDATYRLPPSENIVSL
jgi:nucleotide sugar dehydrogenase